MMTLRISHLESDFLNAKYTLFSCTRDGIGIISNKKHTLSPGSLILIGLFFVRVKQHPLSISLTRGSMKSLRVLWRMSTVFWNSDLYTYCNCFAY